MNDNNGKRNCILVAGMHRSGTSSVAGLLSGMGCQLPLNLLEASEFNKKGHFESVAINRFNDTLLSSMQSEWRSWWNDSQLPNGLERKQLILSASALLAQEFDSSNLFVLKDPRICLLLPFWRDVLEDLGIGCKVVIPFRPATEVAASLYTRNKLPIEAGLLLWLKYILISEQESREMPRVVLSYDHLLSDWRSQANLLRKSFSDVTWPTLSAGAEAELQDFLTPGLRHEGGNIEDIPQLILDLVSEVEAVFGGCEGELTASDLLQIDRVAAEHQRFSSAVSPLYGSLHVEASTKTNRVAELKRRLAEVEVSADIFDEVIRERNDLKIRIEALVLEIEKRKTEKSELKRNISSLTASLEKERDEGVQRAEQLDSLQNELKQTKNDVTGLRRDNKSLRERAVQKSQGHKKEIASRSESLRILEREVAHYQKLYERAQSDWNSISAELQDARGVQLGLESKLQAMRPLISEKLALEDQLAEVMMTSGQPQSLFNRIFGKSRPVEENTKRANSLRRIRSSDLFDEQWYLERYPDVQQAGVDPAEHYLDCGESEGRRPSPNFASADYFARYPDVAKAGHNALVHFIEFGRYEGRQPYSDDGGEVDWYAQQYRIVSSSEMFDQAWYLEQNPDVLKLGLDPVAHYIEHGASEGRDPGPLFSSFYYSQFNPDTGAMNPLVHFELHGRKEGRASHISRFAATDQFGRTIRDPSESKAGGEIATTSSFTHYRGQLPTLKVDQEEGAVDALGLVLASTASDSEAMALSSAISCLKRMHQIENDDVSDQDMATSMMLDASRLIDLQFTTRVTLQTVIEAQNTQEVLRLYQWDSTAQRLRELGQSLSHSIARDRTGFRLLNHYEPILLVWTDDSGKLLRSSLLPFPSLCRNGDHYPEYAVSGQSVGYIEGLSNLGLKYVRALAHVTEPTIIGLAVETLVGHERIVARTLREWIKNVFGGEFVFVGADKDVPTILKDSAELVSEISGSSCLVAYNDIPSISALVQSDSSACFVEAIHGRPPLQMRNLGYSSKSMLSPSDRNGALTLRRGAIVADSRPLQESDKLLPFNSGNDDLFVVSVDVLVVIDSSEFNDVSELSRSLFYQSGLKCRSIRIISCVDGIAGLSSIESLSAESILYPVSSPIEIADGLNSALLDCENDHCLIVTPAIRMFDSRTLQQLYQVLLSNPGSIAAGCQVLEPFKKGKKTHYRAGFSGFVLRESSRTDVNLIVADDFDELLHRSVVPIASVSPALALVNRSCWQALGGMTPGDNWEEAFLRLVITAGAQGCAGMLTSQVSALNLCSNLPVLPCLEEYSIDDIDQVKANTFSVRLGSS